MENSLPLNPENATAADALTSKEAKHEEVSAAEAVAKELAGKELAGKELGEEAKAPVEILSGAMATQHATTTGH